MGRISRLIVTPRAGWFVRLSDMLGPGGGALEWSVGLAAPPG